ENKRYEQALQTAVWPDAAKVPRRIPYLLSRSANPDAPRARTTPLYFYGPAETFPVYSYAGVLSDQYSMQALHEKFGGRIVFVGATAPFLKDVFIMPNIESGRRKTARGEEFAGMPEEATSAEISGVELHATMAAMLLDGQYLKTASTQFTLAVLFGLTLATGAWIIALRRPVNWLARRSQLLAAQRRRIAPLHSMVWFGCYALLGPLPIFLFWQAAIWAFAHRDFWIIAVYPMAGAALGGLSALLLLFSSETVERRKTATQMGRFMSAGILEEVLARPEEEYPRPRRMRATIFFTDLQ